MWLKYPYLMTFALLTICCLPHLVTAQAFALIDEKRSAHPAGSSQLGSLLATETFPASGARNVCPDTPLRITFGDAPVTGAGAIQVYDASTNTLVQSIGVAVPVLTKSIGGLPNYNYYPIIISGNVASIYLPNSVLGYGETYYVKITPGAFKDAGGHAFPGLTDSKAWRFSTRSRPPVSGSKRITVAADGTGDFCTVQGAIDFVPEGNTKPITIFIRNGTYQEIIFFTGKHNLTILGEDRRKTIIAYANNDRFNNNSGGNPFATGAAAPGAVPARGGAVYRRGLFLAHRVNDLTIANLTLHNTTPQGGSQAEAIILNGTPTAHAIITNVDLYSFQDTLQINGQAYISNCYIEGDVDFMWGTGPCFFENCHARSVRGNAYYTQIRNPATNHGFVYQNCVFDGAPGVTGNFLSRVAPARFPASEVVLINCVLTESVGPVAWKLDPAPGASPGSPIAAPTVHYWEYQSHDPAGNPIDLSRRLSIAKELKLEADRETIANYSDPMFVLGGWAPALAPIITSEPVSVSTRVGSKVVLSVSVAAVPAPKFQWQKNGKDVDGATQADLEIKKVDRRDAGRYQVVISNNAGRVTSVAAKLTVTRSIQ